MWLPVDERRLLAAFYRTISDVDIEEAFEIDELRNVLGSCSRYGKRIVSYEESAGKQEGTALSMKQQMCAIKQLEGYDLGRRYANWFDRSGLWFQEYRDHWLWLIIAFFGGAIISNVIQNLIG